MPEALESDPPLLDPISNQPPEIVTEIFKSIAGDTVSLPLRIRQGPWVLGHVCSRWRKILWSSPSIWSSITITPQTPVLIGTLWDRERAIRNPLSFIISATTFPLSLIVEDGNANIRLDIILPHIGRFRNLSLDYIPPEAFVSILRLPPDSFRLLETFSTMTYKHESMLMPTTSSLETAPNLRSVKYQIINDVYISQCLLLPLENMTHVIIQRMVVPLDVVQRILLSSPRLVECSFLIGAEEVPTSMRRKTLPNLRTLRLKAPRVIDWPTFLNSFVIPALEDFSIISPGLPLNPVNSLLTRSSCPLKHLTLVLSNLYVDSTDPVGVEALLGLVPSSIISLNFSWTVSGSIFSRMQHGLLPKLETIRLHVDKYGLQAFARLPGLYSRRLRREAWSLRRAEICYWMETGAIKQYTQRVRPTRTFDGLGIAVFDAETGLDVMDDSGMEYMDESDSEDGGNHGVVI